MLPPHGPAPRVDRVRAIRRFTVRTVLPAALEPLASVVTNLRWSWHPETRDLFAAVDPTVWREVEHDPTRLLGAVSRERLAELVRPGGQVLLFGGCAPGARVSFDAARLHYAELALVGSFHYTPEDARAALGALASGEVDPRPLVAARGKLEDLPRFLDAQARGEGVRYAIAVRQ